jgi:hypothetical protein
VDVVRLAVLSALSIGDSATGALFTPSITKTTFPVGAAGTPEAVSVTVALKVTAWPKNTEFDDDKTAVEVEAGVTVWPPLSVPLVLAKFPSALR